jgi:hypothetical protein
MSRFRVVQILSGPEPPHDSHVSVMIPYPVYQQVLAYLEAINSSLKPDDLIASIVEGWARRLNM